MLVPFRYLRERANKRKEHDSHAFTLENSNLSPGQIVTAQKTLRILGLEQRLDELKKEDVVVFLYAMGLNPTDDIIDSKLRNFKLHNKKTFTFGQLAHVWFSMLQDLTDEDEILKRAFQFFDKDGNGEISVQELRTTMHELGDLLTEDEITAFMQIMDVNNDGVIGYTEFLATLKMQAPSSLAGGGEEGPGSLEPGEQPRQQQPGQQPLALPAPSAAGATANGTPVPHALGVPSKAAASPFAGFPAAGDGVNGAATTAAAAAAAVPGGKSLTTSPGAVVTAAPLPAFPPRRQPLLKAGPALPPRAAPPESLLPPDAAAATPPPPALPRQASRRLGQSLSMSRSASGSGSGLPPMAPLERVGSLRRADDAPPRPPLAPGSRSGSGGGGAGGVDSGQGLRSPSVLDLGSGGEGT